MPFNARTLKIMSMSVKEENETINLPNLCRNSKNTMQTIQPSILPCQELGRRGISTDVADTILHPSNTHTLELAVCSPILEQQQLLDQELGLSEFRNGPLVLLEEPVNAKTFEDVQISRNITTCNLSLSHELNQYNILSFQTVPNVQIEYINSCSPKQSSLPEKNDKDQDETEENETNKNVYRENDRDLENDLFQTQNAKDQDETEENETSKIVYRENDRDLENDLFQTQNAKNKDETEETGNDIEDNGGLENNIQQYGFEENLDIRTRRKRQHVNDDDWGKNSNKKKREKGMPYLGKNKQAESWDYGVRRQRKTLGPQCHCKISGNSSKLKCRIFEEEDRKAIFESFWKLSWKEKKLYVKLLCNKTETKRSRNRKNEDQSQRDTTYFYFLIKSHEKLRVCKTMFANTLALKAWTIHNWLKSCDKVNDGPTPEQNTEVVSDARPLKSSEKKAHLKEFFESLPKMESHYCRKSSKKLYLEPKWRSKSELYALYKTEWCPNLKEEPLSITMFSHMFEDLNLSLFTPKKDECDVCVSFRAGNVAQAEYDLHIVKKNEARDEKEKDKSNGDKNTAIYTMDMQKVLLCPQSNASALYFKMKLAVHNFTVFDLKTKKGYCFIWHEAEAGLTANIFASILCQFIEKQLASNNNIDQTTRSTFIFYSDGCTCQNRNSTLANALLNLAMDKQITILQKYLLPGHTQMECDNMHSKIERRIKGRKINLPADYVQICRASSLERNGYEVSYLDHTFFKKFDSVNFVSSIRPGRKAGDPTVMDIKALKYNPDGKIYFKIRHTDEWNELLCRYNKSAKVTKFKDLPPVYKTPVGVKSDKYGHLMALKTTMESDYHTFYDNLVVQPK